jgi:hypothetical protein
MSVVGVVVTLDTPDALLFRWWAKRQATGSGPFDAPLAAYLRGLFRLALHHLAICEARTGALRPVHDIPKLEHHRLPAQLHRKLQKRLAWFFAVYCLYFSVIDECLVLKQLPLPSFIGSHFSTNNPPCRLTAHTNLTFTQL